MSARAECAVRALYDACRADGDLRHEAVHRPDFVVVRLLKKDGVGSALASFDVAGERVAGGREVAHRLVQQVRWAGELQRGRALQVSLVLEEDDFDAAAEPGTRELGVRRVAHGLHFALQDFLAIESELQATKVRQW